MKITNADTYKWTSRTILLTWFVHGSEAMVPASRYQIRYGSSNNVKIWHVLRGEFPVFFVCFRFINNKDLKGCEWSTMISV